MSFWLRFLAPAGRFGLNFASPPVVHLPFRNKSASAKGKVAVSGGGVRPLAAENVELALRKLGLYVAEKNDHTSIMIIGNEATGLWKKAFALAPAASLIQIIEQVAADKGSGSQ